MVLLGITIATVASFLASALLYASPPVARLLARTSTPRPGIPAPVQLATVILRSVLASLLVAGILVAASWQGALPGAVLGMSLSIIPALLLAGSVIHENTPISVAAVHLLDWVIKLTLIGSITGAFV